MNFFKMIQIHIVKCPSHQRMDEIIFRKLCNSDIAVVRHMLEEIWEIDKFTAGDSKTANNIISSILYNDLANQNYSEVAVLDGKVVGVLLARIKINKQTHTIWSFKSKYHSFCLKTFRKGNDGCSEYLKVDNSFKKLLAQNTSDSELIFFMVDDNIRGKGIGKSLLSHYMDECRSRNINNLCLVTDTQCNYEYYDKNGFTLECNDIFRLDLPSGSIEHKTFLYSYRF